MTPITRMAMFLGFGGMFWTLMVLTIPRWSTVTEAQEESIFGTLVIGALFTCTGIIVWAIGLATRAIIDCLEDEDWADDPADSPPSTENQP